MSEMLANRYFQSGRFEEAARQLERTLHDHPERHSAHRKLICCYLMTDRVTEAVTATARLVGTAPAALHGADPADEGFPCRSSAEAMQKLSPALTEGERHAALALVSLLFGDTGVLEGLSRAASCDPPLAEAGTLRRVLALHPEALHA